MTPPERPRALILVVDDHEAMRGGLVAMLETLGYWTISAKHGQEALALLRSGKRPALILLDLMMPVMDGRTFRREQLKDPALADIPVVVISIYGEEFAQEDTLGIEVVLQKPVPLAALRQAVERYEGVGMDTDRAASPTA